MDRVFSRLDGFTENEMMQSWLHPRTAYIHIPFCGHKCGYCDFAVTAGQDHLITLYLEALAEEIARLGTPRPVESIFIGGGTPTYLNAAQLDDLLTHLNRWLPIGNAGEFSIESTPESIDAEKLSVLKRHGINRVSIGVQSFQSHTLAALDRRHTVDQIPSAVTLIQATDMAVSLDMIFGAPGQTLDDWRRDLEQAITFQPEHISTYGLTYEKGTPLWKERERGKVVPISEEIELQQYQYSMATLPRHGYGQYEISNFAKPGQYSRHNARYWANDAYYGFGVGAARYVEGRRELNIRNTQSYIKRILSGKSATFQTESLNPRERAWETITTQIRRVEGIDRGEFHNRTGHDLDALIADSLTMLLQENLVIDKGLSVALTQKGRCLANGVILQLLSHS